MAKSFVHFLEEVCGIKGVDRIHNGDLMRSVKYFGGFFIALPPLPGQITI